MNLNGKITVPEAFQQDREWLNLLHCIPVSLFVCHSHVADLIRMTNAVLNLILYEHVNNMQVESTDNMCA